MPAIAIRTGTRIGEPDADEDDQYLFDAFVELPHFSDIYDISSPRSVIYGRTGTGKTAIIRRIEKRFDNVIRIDPKTIALDHIANSDIISFLETLEVDLHIFYELLWKHVICVTLIRDIFGVTSAQTEASLVTKLLAQLSLDKGKLECLDYLKSWGKNFWIDSDAQVREIATHFEEQIKGGLSTAIGPLKGDLNALALREKSERYELRQRARKIVNEIQIGKLNTVLEILNGVLSKNRHRMYYVCIDNLDDRWVDRRIQFKLIRALIESIFSKSRSIKNRSGNPRRLLRKGSGRNKRYRISKRKVRNLHNKLEMDSN